MKREREKEREREREREREIERERLYVSSVWLNIFNLSVCIADAYLYFYEVGDETDRTGGGIFIDIAEGYLSCHYV